MSKWAVAYTDFHNNDLSIVIVAADSFLTAIKQHPSVRVFGDEWITSLEGIKTHLPFPLTKFNSKAKYVYVARNPWDNCVSYYNMIRVSALRRGLREGRSRTFSRTTFGAKSRSGTTSSTYWPDTS